MSFSAAVLCVWPRLRGFSLIELMVVMAIISGMIACLMPALGRARERAEMVTCMSNLKQVGYTVQGYCDDNEGLFPDLFFSFGPGNSNTIVILIRPPRAATIGWQAFLDIEPILSCPTDRDVDMVDYLTRDGNIDQIPFSYGYNIDLLLREVRYHRIIDHTSPANLTLFFDGNPINARRNQNSNGNNTIQGHYFSSLEYATTTVEYRHFEQSNALFLDWHVESFIPAKFDAGTVALDGTPAGAGNGNGGGGNGNN